MYEKLKTIFTFFLFIYYIYLYIIYNWLKAMCTLFPISSFFVLILTFYPTLSDATFCASYTTSYTKNPLI